MSLRQVNVGGRSTGIMDMDETFQKYIKRGKKPEDSTGDELVEDLKKLNFIVEGPRRCARRPFDRVSEVLRSQEEMMILGYGSFLTT